MMQQFGVSPLGLICSVAKGLLRGIDHVEEAVFVLLLLVDLRDWGGNTHHAVLVHQQEEGLGGVQLQAAPGGRTKGSHCSLTGQAIQPNYSCTITKTQKGWPSCSRGTAKSKILQHTEKDTECWWACLWPRLRTVLLPAFPQPRSSVVPFYVQSPGLASLFTAGKTPVWRATTSHCR